jgi:hypothetical protein
MLETLKANSSWRRILSTTPVLVLDQFFIIGTVMPTHKSPVLLLLFLKEALKVQKA